EFDFIENWILPRLDVQKGFVNIGMTTYGTGSTTIYDFNYNRQQICENLEKLWNNVDIESANNVPLSRDQADVDAAGAQVEYYIDNRMALNFSVVVVNYGNCSFNSWPKMHTNVYDTHSIDVDQLSDYVDDSVCDPTAPLPTVPNHETPTMFAPTVPHHETTTTKPTRKPTPTVPSLPVASINNTGCNCVLKTVWLDVFLLMEATTAMTPNGINSATDYVVSAFTKLTVGQAVQYQTRFGVIRYASSVDLIADLDKYTSTADLFDLNISSLNETGTNIEGAIRMATSKFASKSHRLAARPVLIIVGSSYKLSFFNEDMLRSGGYNDPTQAAGEFREDGGTIITIGRICAGARADSAITTIAGFAKLQSDK
ncbi:von Willebrand factor type A domain protein, partial [Teladorsagia circumcincta]